MSKLSLILHTFSITGLVAGLFLTSKVTNTTLNMRQKYRHNIAPTLNNNTVDNNGDIINI